MTRIAWILGAPVTEPGGKLARSRSESRASARSVPRTVETRCQTPGAGRGSLSAVTSTEPYSHTRPRSLRIRSTIITFSARSFTDAARAARVSSARLPSRPSASTRGAVPLIGSVTTSRPLRRRNSSGERLQTAPHSPAITPPWRGSSVPAVRAKRSSGSPFHSASSRRQRFAWKISPAAIRSRHSSIALMWPAPPGGAGWKLPTQTGRSRTPSARRPRMP